MINQITKPVGLTPLLDTKPLKEQDIDMPTFLDVFKRIAGDAASNQQIKAQDMLDIMLGNVDDLERVQTNITKAQLSMELLTNTRNAMLEAYNEIVKMSI